jgi:alpha-N-arabinofuranosidase
MKTKLRTLFSLGLALCLSLGMVSCDAVPEDGKAHFASFTYTGNDQIYNEVPLDGTNFYNPIIQGFYPDPAIVRKGNDYYLVVSSFAFYPGVPIFHSNDLVNWKQVGHVLDRPEQLPLGAGVGSSQGIFAPSIAYNPHNETFYMITTNTSDPLGNFFVKTQDPAGDWSDPITLPEINGIDPSFFFDEDGKGYIVHNGVTDGPALYDGHRTVRVWEFDPATDKITGGGHVIINGGVNLAEQPSWIEAPHMYKRNGKYYLMCAEGGTSINHSEVIFESDKPLGPYTPAPNNPILTQRHLTGPRGYEVTSAGHADIVSTPNDDHYGVFLAVRPYEGNKYNTGREVFILPVDWSGEFPVFVGGHDPIQPTLPLPAGVENKTGKDGFLPNGNWTYTDEFDAGELSQRWLMLRTPDSTFYAFQDGELVLDKKAVSTKERKNPSLVGFRQQHITFSAQTDLQFVPENETDLAGMVCFQDDQYNYIFGLTLVNGERSLVLEKTFRGTSEIVASQPFNKDRVTLKIEGDKANYSFAYSTDGGKKFTYLAQNQDGSILSTDVAGGFIGNIICLYATSAKDNVWTPQFRRRPQPAE